MTITENNFASKADAAVNRLKKDKRDKFVLTTTKIRSLLAMSADIYNSVRECNEENLPQELCGRIQYLKIRMVYEAGRDDSVKDFLKKSDLLKIVDEINGKRQNYLLYSKYMEALVAYHRFYGGDDEKGGKH